MDPLLRAHLNMLSNTGKSGQINESHYPAVPNPGAEKSGGGAATGKPVGKAKAAGGKKYPSLKEDAMNTYEALAELSEEELDHVLDNLTEDEQEELAHMVDFCEAVALAEAIADLDEDELADLAEELDDDELDAIEEAIDISDEADELDELDEERGGFRRNKDGSGYYTPTKKENDFAARSKRRDAWAKKKTGLHSKPIADWSDENHASWKAAYNHPDNK